MKTKKLFLVTAIISALSFATVFLPTPVYAGQACVKVAIKINGQDCVPQQDAIMAWFKMILLFLSGGVGIAAVGGIVWGGILYTTARDNAAQTQKAVTIITNAIIAILLFVFMYAILNFLIPGGIVI
jgi:riboflavin transporter FmnP